MISFLEAAQHYASLGWRVFPVKPRDKVPIVKGHYGYVLHSDHSIPNTVNYDTYQYFIQRGLELGKY